MSDDDRARRHATLAAGSRLRLLELLRRSASAQDVRALAEASGLAVSTARFHLDVLVRDGLVTASTPATGARGRPMTVYASATPYPDRVRSADPALDGYRTLVAVLADELGGTRAERERRAERAGRAWAAAIRPRTATGTAADPAGGVSDEVDPVRVVGGLLAELGFDPDLADEPGGPRIRLHACPFLPVARSRPEVVCTVHLGLIRGVLDAAGAAGEQATLVPFAEPGVCVAALPGAPPTGAVRR